MNDRYLYRAKRTDNGEWVEGYYAVARDRKGLTQHNILIADNDIGYFKWIVVDPLTICQCIGLKDKNGKLIFENDILNSGNLVVTWREELASYCITKKGWMYQHFFGEAIDSCYCEVIGNIFDHKELLEVGE